MDGKENSGPELEKSVEQLTRKLKDHQDANKILQKAVLERSHLLQKVHVELHRLLGRVLERVCLLQYLSLFPNYLD